MEEKEMEVSEEKKELPKKKKEEEKKEEKKEKKQEKETQKYEQELKEKDEKILRISAEMQNIKRRCEEEKQKLLKYDGEEVIIKVLTVLDNFEHAIHMDDNDLTDEVSKFLSGFKMIYANLIDTLKSFGVEEIECLHKPFNEMEMNAVLIDHDQNFEDDIVLDVLQKGYLYKDKIIRPAMVKVNKKESE